jgi:hypothetical protein
MTSPIWGAPRSRVGDPDYGLEEWPEEHLRYLYLGTALFLEPIGNR